MFPSEGFQRRGYATVQGAIASVELTAWRSEDDVPAGFHGWTIKAGLPHLVAPNELLGRMLTIRIALDDCGPENGPLRLAPGSHCAESLEAGAGSLEFEKQETVTCLTSAGDLVLMRPTVHHSSRQATTPGTRRVVHLEYAAEDLPAPLRWRDW